MNRIIKLIIKFSCPLIFVMAASPAYSQEIAEIQDTTVRIIAKTPLLDSSLVDISIFHLLDNSSYGEGKIEINQNSNMHNAYIQYISTNPSRKNTGYRIRIFFDNKQNSRSNSEYIKQKFEELFPTIPAYRSTSNPYFKVAVGDFRTKSDAIKMLGAIKEHYPNAFITPKETINYPAIELGK